MDEKYKFAINDLDEQVGKLYLLFEGLKRIPEVLNEVNYKVGSINNRQEIFRLQSTIDVVNRLLFYTLVDLQGIQEIIFGCQEALTELIDQTEERAGSSYEH